MPHQRTIYDSVRRTPSNNKSSHLCRHTSSIHNSVFIDEKNMLVQNIQQTYATTTQALFSTFNSKEYLEMSPRLQN
jgi:hypothetical protein